MLSKTFLDSDIFTWTEIKSPFLQAVSFSVSTTLFPSVFNKGNLTDTAYEYPYLQVITIE